MKNSRREFFILTAAIFLVGVVLYGIVGITAFFTVPDIGEAVNPVLFCILTALAGGYFFFSILSGVLFTARWVSKKSLKGKILLTVFFVIPLWLAAAGVFYCIPYGIYNFAEYRKLCKGK